MSIASFGIYHPSFWLPVFPFLFLLHLCLNLRKPRKKLKKWKNIYNQFCEFLGETFCGYYVPISNMYKIQYIKD